MAGSSFDAGRRRLDLRIDFPRGAKFACPECEAAGCEVHDTDEKTWRHLDFFEHQAFLTARVPRVRCAEHGVRQVRVPWARPGSGFTLLFEALVMTLVAEMPVKAVGDLVGEHDTRIWRVVHHYVDRALAAEDLSAVTRVAVDETSFRRGQDYVSVFADIDQARVVFVTPGRDAGAYVRFAEDLAGHGGLADQVAEVCQDLSESYLTGALEHLPAADITFDRYHIKAQLTRAVDEVRRAERAEHGQLLRHTRWLWLKSPRNLTSRQADKLAELLRLPLAIGRAYRWMLRFDGVYELADPDEAAAYLRRFTSGARRSRLEPIIDFARMVDEYWLGIVRWWHSRISNGVLEGLHSLAQAAKRRACGYRSTRNYIAMIHLTAASSTSPRPPEVARSLDAASRLDKGPDQKKVRPPCATAFSGVELPSAVETFIFQVIDVVAGVGAGLLLLAGIKKLRHPSTATVGMVLGISRAEIGGVPGSGETARA